MSAMPTLRVNGSMLEVLQDGRVVTRYSLGESNYHVRIDGSAVELTADGEVIDRYPLEDRSAPSDGQMTRIPIRESETTDHSQVMFY